MREEDMPGGGEGGRGRGGRKERKFGQITIRRIDRTLYEQVSQLARSMGVNVGTVVNRALELFLSLSPGEVTPGSPVAKNFLAGFLEGLGHLVRDVDELTLTREDLEAADGRLVLAEIGRLEFAEDVDPETFRSKVAAIVSCRELVLPPSLPKVLVLSVARRVGRVTVSGGEGG